MDIHIHYCTVGFANCYVIGIQSKIDVAIREAVIVDPGYIDNDILNFIENGDFNLKAVLITHNHKNHIYGLKTLLRIYNVNVYSAQIINKNINTFIVHDASSIDIGSFHFDVIAIPGHSTDSVVYKIDRYLFTGDVISAGIMGSIQSPYSGIRQIAKLQTNIFSLPGNYFIFPGHGPPTSLEIERLYNIDNSRYHSSHMKINQMRYNLDLLD